MKAAIRTAALVMALGPAVAGAAEPWYEAYGKGLRALQARNWAAAELHLKSAMRSGPPPGRKVRAYGLRFIDFLPGYYLGLTYFGQQKYREALAELQRVEASGLVAKGDREFPRLVEVMEQATARLAARTSPPPPPSSVISPPRPSEAERDAQALVEYARQMLEQGHLADARKALDSARAKDAANPNLAPLAALLAQREAARSAQVAREAEARALPRMADLPAARPTLPPARPAPVEARPPTDKTAELERAGRRAFYAGQYEAAARVLAPFADGRLRSARALVYLAYSNSALGLLRGKEGAPLLEVARRQFREARRLDPRIRLDDRLVSPRIARLLTQAGGS